MQRERLAFGAQLAQRVDFFPHAGFEAREIGRGFGQHKVSIDTIYVNLLRFQIASIFCREGRAEMCVHADSTLTKIRETFSDFGCKPYRVRLTADTSDFKVVSRKRG